MANAKETPLSPFSPPFSPRYAPSPDPLSIDPEIWLMAEQRTQEVLHVVQPNVFSDKRRKTVINYVKGLINGYFGTEVFAFGSVPLKTYLPDGDVDLIAFCYPNMVEDFARQVCVLLKGDTDHDYQVPYVEYIDAQVKVVKCTVEGIAVDISFNQISGICTLCFLEQADLLVGKDHLFKRSVLLIKSWFYYESRILGAHHGLISTYALETMILYVISLCHETVRGPLEVLYRFLEYYSKFDWENNCITIHGPVTITSLVEKTAEMPEVDASKIFLSKDFLKNCKDMFAIRIKSYEGEVPEFLVKHLNILDPLKPNNNLGRSVSKVSFNRITAAMSYGIQKLKEILVLPGEFIGERLEKFYQLTLERNGQGLRPDLLVPVAAFGTGKCEAFDLTADSDSYYGGLRFTQMFSNYTYVWDENTLSWKLQASNGTPQMGPDVFIPGQPFIYHNSPLQPGAQFNAFRQRRSRGTGTYIPEAHTQSSYQDTYWRGKRRVPEYTRPGSWQKSGQKSVQTYRVHSIPNTMEKREAENKNLLDLSHNSFPVLQVASQAGPSGINEISAQLNAFQVSPPPLVSSPVAATGIADKSGSSSLVSAIATAETGVDKEAQLSENIEEKDKISAQLDQLEKDKISAQLNQLEKDKISAQLYQLENDMDFPPLSG